MDIDGDGYVRGRKDIAERERCSMSSVRATTVTVSIDDDLRRSRLTSFFRVLLAIPHFIVIGVLGFIAMFAILIGWICALFTGRLPGGIHNYLARLLNYSFQLNAYLYYVVDPYPPFFSTAPWRANLQIAEPVKQGRWGIFFRVLLAYPALIFNAFLSYGMLVAWIGAWWVILFTGRVPRGLRNFMLYGTRISAHVRAYTYVLTPQYPNIDPLQGLAGADQPQVDTSAA